MTKRNIARILILFLLFMGFEKAHAQQWKEIAQSLPDPYDLTVNGQFGYSIDMDGNYAVVGAPSVDRYGAAYVLFYNGSQWVFQAKLSATLTGFARSFGTSVSISGDNIVVGCISAAYVYTKPTNGWTDTNIPNASLTPSKSYSDFGVSVAISSNTIIVGDPDDNENGTYAGAAYVFEKPGASWTGNISHVAKLLASDGDGYDDLGETVDIDGDDIILGAPRMDIATNQPRGAAYVYTKPATGWVNATETAKLSAQAIHNVNNFAQSVGISGDHIVIGSSFYGRGNGYAFVYKKPSTGWVNATESATLTPSDGNDYDGFGKSVHIYGAEIIVSSPADDDNGDGSGVAFVFKKPTTGWTSGTETAKLLTSDGTAADGFGYRVAISNGKVLSSAIRKATKGVTYAYTKSGANWTNVNENQKISPSQIIGNVNDQYGSSVAIDGSTAVIGMPAAHNYEGMAYVLFYNGNSWVRQAILRPSEGKLHYGQQFGGSVAISGNTIVVGGQGHQQQGQTYVFEKPEKGWRDMTETAELTASDGPGYYTYFGNSVAISESGNEIVIGANHDNAGASTSGSVYVYTKPGANWTSMTETAKLTPTDPTSYGYFGASISISNNNIVIGASRAMNGGINTGAAYVFTKPVGGWVSGTETAKLTASNGADSHYFGSDVSIDQGNIVIGSGNESVYVYSKTTGSWTSTTETAILTASDGTNRDNFGSSVDIENDIIIVGAPGKSGEGAIYTFVKPSSAWVSANEKSQTKASNVAYGNFGGSLSLDGDFIVVGNNEYNSDRGTAYLMLKDLSTHFAFAVSECGSYTSPSGKVITSSGTVMDTIPNSIGGDSIMTITATIGASSPVVTTLADSGPGSLRQAIADACVGATIRFDPNLLTASVDSISLNTEIAFSKSLSIKGLYTATDTLFISGAGNSGIFRISGEKIILDSLVLINGNSSSLGGAIYSTSNNDTLLVSNSKISNCKAAYSGGGIYIMAGWSKIENSIIENNKLNGSSVFGAGICAIGDEIEIINSTIKNNSIIGTGYGGGIYASCKPILIKSSTINNNDAGSNGGGIFVARGHSYIQNSTIVNNTCSNSGREIFADLDTINITNSTIYNNGSYGLSAIEISRSSVAEISNSIVFNNGVSISNATSTVSSKGYNIFNDDRRNFGITTLPTDSININASQLNLGPLQNNGGYTKTLIPLCGSVAINAGNPSDMSDAQNGTIVGRRDIGAAENRSLTSTTSAFTASGCNSYITPSGKIINNSSIVTDTIPNACGADSIMTITVNIGSTNPIVTTLADSGSGSLRQAIADACDGDTVRFDPSLLTTGVDSISLSTEIAFSKALTIIGLNSYTDTLFISGAGNSRIFNITNAGKVTLDSLTLINGYSTANGGAIYSYNSTDTLHIFNTKISNNILSGNNRRGAGIYTENGILEISHSTITNNKLTDYNVRGAGVCSFYGDAVINNSTFRNNSITGAGGGAGLYMFSGVLSINGSLITENSAEGSGGGIDVYDATITIKGSEISFNASSVGGAGVNIQNGTIEISNSTINNNRYLIFNGGSSSIGRGGAISVKKGKTLINGSTITENLSNSVGGAIVADQDTITITNSTIYNNHTSGSSNELYIKDSKFNIVSSIVANSGYTQGSSANFVTEFIGGTATSNGYNIFNDTPAFASGTDLTNVTTTQLNLDTLRNNKGATATRDPLCGSVAINAGNPADMSDAQNMPIVERREIGAAENWQAVSSDSSFSATGCSSYTTPSGKVINTTSTVMDTIRNTCGADSVMTIAVTIGDVTAPTVVTTDATIFLDINGMASIIAADIDNGSTDNCGIASMSLDSTSFDCSEIGRNTVTLTVTDNNNNSNTGTAIITVEDTIKPTVLTQNITVYLNANGLASIATTDINNGSTDICGIASMSLDSTTFDCSEVGANTVTLSVTDNNNNVGSSTATVTVLDTISPTAAAQDITIYLDANGSASITMTDIDNGSIDNCSNFNLSLSKTTFDCSMLGANTVSLYATDASMNIDSSTATVTVLDTLKPNVVTTDATIFLDANGLASIIPADIDNGSTDACGILSLNLDSTTFDCSEVGGNTVTLSVTDNNNNVGTNTAVITVEDTIRPTVMTQDITVYLDANGSASITTTDIDNGSADFCGLQNISLNTTSFDCSNIGGNTVTLRVTDNNNNVDSATAIVTVMDTIKPAVSTQDITVYLDANGMANITTADINNGSAVACGIQSMNLDVTTFDCSNIGGNTVTLRITDSNNNVDSATAIVTVMDTINPNIVTQNITVYLDANGMANITTADIDNGSADACGLLNMSLDSTTFDCSEIGVNTVTLRVSDNNNNIDSSTATVTVVDTINPNVATQNITVYLDANGSASISTSDIDNGSMDACGIATMSLNTSSFDCSNVGGNTITLTVTDNNNNVDSTTAVVTVLDTINPNVTTQDITVYIDANGSASITTSDIDNGSTDACGIQMMSLDVTAFSCNETGANTVSLRVTDNNNNVDSATATVTVMDTIRPLISNCVVNINQVVDPGACTAIVSWTTPTAIDNCAVDSLASSHNSGDVFALGTTVVTYIAYDPSMNTDTCQFTITITDNEKPIISNVPVNINVSNDLDQCSAVVSWSAPVATDNCMFDSLRSNYQPGAIFPIGTTTVSYIAYDASMNTDTASFTVTVNDTAKPIISCPSSIAQCDSIVSFNDATATDNCGIASLVRTDATGFNSGDQFPVGVTTLTYQVTDVNNNQATCSVDIEVYNPPVANAGPDLTTRDIQPIVIEASSMNAASYRWTPSESLISATVEQPVANPQTTTVYTMEVTSPEGCVASDEVEVTVNVVNKLDATTLFSPNGDGMNDTWVVNKPDLIKGCQLIIVNRNGTEVYTTDNYNNEWDGTIDGEQLPEGTYYYIFDCPDGRSLNGPITILRERR